MFQNDDFAAAICANRIWCRFQPYKFSILAFHMREEVKLADRKVPMIIMIIIKSLTPSTI